MHTLIKNFILVFLLALTATQLTAQTHKISDPIAYNDYIVDQQNRIGEELLKLIGMFDALPEDKAVCTDQLDVIISTCRSATTNVQNLKPIEKEFGMKLAALELFAFYNETMDTDYRLVIDELYKDTPDLELLNQILVRIQTAEGEVDEKFQGAQESFAKYHKISLQENDLQEEFDETGE
jgi:hypothetical protein